MPRAEAPRRPTREQDASGREAWPWPQCRFPRRSPPTLLTLRRLLRPSQRETRECAKPPPKRTTKSLALTSENCKVRCNFKQFRGRRNVGRRLRLAHGPRPGASCLVAVSQLLKTRERRGERAARLRQTRRRTDVQEVRYHVKTHYANGQVALLKYMNLYSYLFKCAPITL